MLAWLIIVVLVTVHGLGLWMSIHVIMNGRSPQGAIAWVMALVFMPWLALPMYFIFGDRKFVGYQRATPGGRREVDQIVQSLMASLRPFAQDSRGGTLDPAIEKLAQLPATNGNHVELLIDGQATFDAIIKAVDLAQRYVLVEFYTVRDDGLGRRFQQTLIAASTRGVRVHFLYDEVGSHRLPSAYLQALTDAGCECTGFRTKPGRRRPFRLNFRNHRKVVIADGRVAFVGGHNIGDEYLGLHKVLTPWRDTHVAIRGPAVQCVQMAFADDWFWATRRVPDLEWSPQPANADDTGGKWEEGGDRGATVLIVPSGPAHDLETCSLLFTRITESAKVTLWLSSAYFVPDESFVAALQLAALRGVDVRAMIPEKSDSLSSKLSSYTYYEELHPAGVKIFRYRAGFLHQKLVLADGLVCVGTANLDNRSFRLNFEMSAIVSDSTFTSEVTAMLTTDLSNSLLVEKGDFDNRPYWFRFCCRVARLLAPVQ